MVSANPSVLVMAPEIALVVSATSFVVVVLDPAPVASATPFVVEVASEYSRMVDIFVINMGLICIRNIQTSYCIAGHIEEETDAAYFVSKQD